MRICFALVLFSLLWATHHCAPKRMFMFSFPRTGVRSHLTHLTLPERPPESPEQAIAAGKRNIAAMARDNLFPPAKRYDEDANFDGDFAYQLISKRDYGEELGPDAGYDDTRDKNDRREYKRDEEAMPRSFGSRNHDPFPIYKNIRYGQG